MSTKVNVDLYIVFAGADQLKVCQAGTLALMF